MAYHHLDHGRFVPTKKGAGIIAFGVPNASLYHVFSDLSDALQRYHFERHGLIFVPHSFETGTSRYMAPVYRPARENPQLPSPLHAEELVDLVERLHHAGREPVAEVALVPLQPRVKIRYVENWDFPHAPLEREFNACSAYFNVHTGPARRARAFEFRDGFLEFLSPSFSASLSSSSSA